MNRRTRFALNHSSGRALARLQLLILLLILIYPPFGTKEHRALARGRTLGASLFLLTFFWRLKKK
ncbi:hypothetical protein EAH72_08820 [Pseudomonas caspiana]|uniref:Uncharacterized protein n=1 Tax=Pseudomonas mandelii TaxID=75612 RepID=A0A502HZZ6_9PSED|nr:hypothetical protein EAH74_25280 [Pseudomonas mandelii]TPG97070.1 hypothetical protein EAH72_08820 [Pseudomonas caspiana]